MNKKIFLLFIAVLLLLGGLPLVYAAPASQNIRDFSGSGGASGITPPTEVVRVRYGASGNSIAGLSSGDVVVWDLNSADGITISRCTVTNAMSYAGVLVTDIATADSSSVLGSSRNWGYMAVKGYVLANIDTSAATAGELLMTNGADATIFGSFATSPSLGGAGTLTISKDIGVLLSDSGSDGLNPVWLK